MLVTGHALPSDHDECCGRPRCGRLGARLRHCGPFGLRQPPVSWREARRMGGRPQREHCDEWPDPSRIVARTEPVAAGWRIDAVIAGGGRAGGAAVDVWAARGCRRSNRFATSAPGHAPTNAGTRRTGADPRANAPTAGSDAGADAAASDIRAAPNDSAPADRDPPSHLIGCARRFPQTVRAGNARHQQCPDATHPLARSTGGYRDMSSQAPRWSCSTAPRHRIRRLLKSPIDATGAEGREVISPLWASSGLAPNGNES
jgi:hypothetical protein